MIRYPSLLNSYPTAVFQLEKILVKKHLRSKTVRNHSERSYTISHASVWFHTNVRMRPSVEQRNKNGTRKNRNSCKKTRGHPGLNQGPLDLQSNALPLSYIPHLEETWILHYMNRFQKITIMLYLSLKWYGSLISKSIEIVLIFITVHAGI